MEKYKHSLKSNSFTCREGRMLWGSIAEPSLLWKFCSGISRQAQANPGCVTQFFLFDTAKDSAHPDPHWAWGWLLHRHSASWAAGTKYPNWWGNSDRVHASLIILRGWEVQDHPASRCGIGESLLLYEELNKIPRPLHEDTYLTHEGSTLLTRSLPWFSTSKYHYGRIRIST